MGKRKNRRSLAEVIEYNKKRPKNAPNPCFKTKFPILVFGDSCSRTLAPIQKNTKFFKEINKNWDKKNFCLRQLAGGSLNQSPDNKNGKHQIMNGQNDLHKFDMMILWLGGNDVSCQPKYGRRRYTTEEAATATLEIFQEIRRKAPDIILLYISVSPRVDVSDGDRLMLYESVKSKVDIADMKDVHFYPFLTADNWPKFKDGIHPHRLGQGPSSLTGIYDIMKHLKIKDFKYIVSIILVVQHI